MLQQYYMRKHAGQSAAGSWRQHLNKKIVSSGPLH